MYFRRCLSDYDTACCLRCVTSFKDSESVKKFIKTDGFHCAIGIHAWRAGRLLLGDIRRDQNVSNMVLSSAGADPGVIPSGIQQFNEEPSHGYMAVSVEPSGFLFHDYFKQVIDAQKQHQISNGYLSPKHSGLTVFMLVAGLRRVKDPLYLAESISEWHKDDNSIHFVIVGPELDTEFATEIKSKVQRFPGVYIFPPLPARDLHAAMQNCFAVVNSSTSEGMASALLESMALGVPILARNIPGNSAVIKHRETGILYNSPEEFVALAKELKKSLTLRKYITTNAKNYVGEHHSLEKETKTYKWLVDKLVSLQRKQCGSTCEA
ncbi:Glycosyltransferase 1 domain-containing protein 1 [Stylophora pistillata]|uniref:Glycosyltransferase 1 domain-containing protein 1 n=1 Tax=Stylophora pistillata TaxID=50429 RepID=A0A2B4RQ98_STYPI|nr:Glycosyltransferase 1 domain-containing protein 1 [Stylophora pistillata]